MQHIGRPFIRCQARRLHGALDFGYEGRASVSVSEATQLAECVEHRQVRCTVPNPQLLTNLVNRHLLPIEVRDFSSPSLWRARETPTVRGRGQEATLLHFLLGC
jgi:hypothetical protein